MGLILSLNIFSFGYPWITDDNMQLTNWLFLPKWCGYFRMILHKLPLHGELSKTDPKPTKCSILGLYTELTIFSNLLWTKCRNRSCWFWICVEPRTVAIQIENGCMLLQVASTNLWNNLLYIGYNSFVLLNLSSHPCITHVSFKYFFISNIDKISFLEGPDYYKKVINFNK